MPKVTELGGKVRSTACSGLCQASWLEQLRQETSQYSILAQSIILLHTFLSTTPYEHQCVQELKQEDSLFRALSQGRLVPGLI